ncbi:hypothetical protein L2E82_03777 [Cichorium intybus]|uniref:Uncharacterized protein n=1 Tax=Cichorium intybus TaxID=13427 RepID=A0ACB9H505_CICIN|nr:hypothetical protein L2E82_03777 [Cichorium intybus]
MLTFTDCSLDIKVVLVLMAMCCVLLLFSTPTCTRTIEVNCTDSGKRLTTPQCPRTYVKLHLSQSIR